MNKNRFRTATVVAVALPVLAVIGASPASAHAFDAIGSFGRIIVTVKSTAPYPMRCQVAVVDQGTTRLFTPGFFDIAANASREYRYENLKQGIYRVQLTCREMLFNTPVTSWDRANIKVVPWVPYA